MLLGVGCGVASQLNAATLSDPEVDRYNLRVGTQTFAGRYDFTTNTLLVETAEAIRDLGSDTLKFYLGNDYPGKYRINLGPNITNLLTLARDEPSVHRVLDLPFRHYIVWVYPLAYWWPFDGYSAGERSSEYREVYDLTRYFLTNCNNSGKTFYFGHWEGDGYLDVTVGGVHWATNPSPTAVQGFIDCLNNRQKAIDDAKRDTAFTNVNVFGYAEANRVRDAMLNGATNNVRMINAVIPYVTNLDYVSYSSYDAQNLSPANLYATLDYMEARLPTNKVAALPGERIWIGEYGWGGTQTPDQQEPTTRAYIQRLLNYGNRALPFILFWEIYDNEGKYYCLIDSNNVKTATYHLHQRFLNRARLLTARFKESNDRLPNDSEFVSLVTPMLDQPLPPPVSLAVSNRAATLLAESSARVSGSLAQGIYGDDQAVVRVCYGRQDGGTALGAWERSQFLGRNTNFNATTFAALLTGLVPGTNYFFRFYATNASGEAWAPASSRFSTETLDPSAFACRMKITFAGYLRAETLANFPVLVSLGTNLPGFDYTRFASPVGGDLRFTDAGGLSPIPHEIDEWNSNGVSSVWVRVPELSGTNGCIWAYWGNPVATNPPAASTNGSVWSFDHHLVWHLKENGFPYADGAQQHPALSGSAPVSTAGLIGRGSVFSGSPRYLDGGVIDLGDTFTLSAWVNVDPTATDIQTIWANQVGGFGSAGFAFYVNSFLTTDHQLRLETGNGALGAVTHTANGAVSFGGWHLLAASVNRTNGTARLFVDGTDVTVSGSVRSDFAKAADVNLGRFVDGAFYYRGRMDEARLERVTRSSNWFWASWLTVVSNATLARYSEVNPRPLLSFTLADGLRLTWPASAGVFRLYSATNLASPTTWLRVTNPSPSLTNGQWQVLLAPHGNDSRFYHLQQ